MTYRKLHSLGKVSKEKNNNTYTKKRYNQYKGNVREPTAPARRLKREFYAIHLNLKRSVLYIHTQIYTHSDLYCLENILN